MNVIHDDAAAAAWVGERLGGRTFMPPFAAYGFAGERGMIAGSVFNDYYEGGNVAWTHAGTLLPQMLRLLARFAFLDLRASRVTAETRRGNNGACRILPRGGFVFEGVRKRYFGPEKADDALVFVMFRAQAERWLR